MTPWDISRKLIEMEAALVRQRGFIQSLLREDPGEDMTRQISDTAVALNEARQALVDLRTSAYQKVEDTRGHVVRKATR